MSLGLWLLLFQLALIPYAPESGLFWQPGGPGPVDGHRIYAHETGMPAGEFAMLAEIPCCRTYFYPQKTLGVALPAGHVTSWYVTAYNAAGESGPSNVVQTVTTAPILICGKRYVAPPELWELGEPCLGCGWCR